MFRLNFSIKINALVIIILVISIFSGPSFAKADTTTGLVGHWTFDNLGSANYIQDMSGNGDHMYIPSGMATTTTTGVYGDAITLDGVNDYLTQAIGATTLSFDKDHAFSFSGWYKPGPTLNPSEDANIASESLFGDLDGSPQRGIVFGFGAAGSCPGDYQVGQTEITSLGLLLFRSGATFISGCTTPDDSILDAGWHHVAVTYDGINQDETGIRIYVDGVSHPVSRSSLPYGNGGSTASPSEMRLGDDRTNDYLDATIDDFRFYDRLLTPEDVLELYTGRPGVTTQSATSTSDTVSILNGTIVSDGMASSTVRGFQYGLTTAYGATSSTSGTYGVGTFTQTVTGLTPSTTYYARAFASSTYGIDYGESITFRTRANVTNGLIGRWTFDNLGSADYIQDMSGQGNHMYIPAVTATTTTTGVLGEAIVLDGINDYLTQTIGATTFSFEKNQSFSFSGWYKPGPTLNPSEDANLASETLFGNTTHSSPRRGIVFGFGGFGTCPGYWGSGLADITSLGLALWNPTGGTMISGCTTPDDSILDAGWHHVVATYDGSQTSAGMRIYLNGASVPVSASTYAYGNASTIVSPSEMRLGDDGTNDYLDATIDDFRFYNRAISANQALSLYTGFYKPEVTTQSASSLIISGATLNGTIVDDGAASSTVRGFQYGLTTAYGATTSTSGTYGTGAYSANITGLTQNTLYHYRAFASSTEGIGYGPNITFTTVADLSIPTMTVQSASNVGTTTVTLNGTITSDGNASSTSRGFNYGTTLSYGATSSTSGTYGVGAYSQNVTGLTPNTTYNVRSYSINSQGIGTSTNTTFTTLALSAPSMTVQAASSITTTGATLNGTITSNGNTIVTTRGFVYGTTSAYGATSSTSGSYSTGAYTASITSLACNTTYHIASFSTNEAGTTYSSDDTFTTSACDYTPAVSEEGVDVATSTATLYGSLDTAPINSTEVGFVYGTTEGGPYEATSTQTGDFGVGSFQNDITGLDNTTTYFFKAYTYNGFEYGYSAENSFTTVDPALLTVIDDSSETLLGTTTINAYVETWGNVPTSVGFVYGTTLGGPYTATVTPSTTFNAYQASNFYVVIPGLDDFTTYYYKAFADNGLTLAYSSEGTFDTLRSPITVEVSDCTELEAVDDDEISSYGDTILLTSNIDCTGVSFAPLWPNYYFSGTIDGQGYEITNLSVDNSGISDNTGLFSRFSGTALDLGIQGEVYGDNYVGMLAGYASADQLSISNVHATGTVSDNGGGYTYIGGLIGYVANYATSTVSNSSFSGDVYGYNSIGGLIGYIYSEASITLSNNNATGTVTSSSVNGENSDAGGMIGYFELNGDGFYVRNNHIYVSVNAGGGYYSGGLLGQLYNDNYFSSSTVLFDQNLVGGSVYTEQTAGGLIGSIQFNDYSTTPKENAYIISNNKVVNTLESTGSTIGGIVGYLYTYDDYYESSDSYMSILNNFASSTIVAESVASGIVGFFENSGQGVNMDFTNNVSVSSLTSNDIATGIAYTDSSERLTLSNNHFDSTKAGTSNCLSVSGTYSSVSGQCVAKSDSTYFKSYSTRAPYTSWNFSTIWQASPNIYPLLRAFESGPAEEVEPSPSPSPSPSSGGGGGSSGSRTTAAKSSPSPTPKPTTTPSVPNTSRSSFTRTLKLGDTGEDVRNLQKFLNTKGYTIATVGAGSPNNESTYFGPATARALAEFQKANSLPPVGLLGPLTLALLNNTPTVPNTTPSTNTSTYTRNLELGSTGEDVRNLQKFLNSKGYTISSTGAGSPGNESTYFGPATQRALIQFQKDNNISPARGYFGPITQSKVK